MKFKKFHVYHSDTFIQFSYAQIVEKAAVVKPPKVIAVKYRRSKYHRGRIIEINKPEKRSGLLIVIDINTYRHRDKSPSLYHILYDKEIGEYFQYSYSRTKKGSGGRPEFIQDPPILRLDPESKPILDEVYDEILNELSKEK